ncbi:MAG: OST-HTH/LOTUS domain-containing protein [Albidovulum sp.]
MRRTPDKPATSSEQPRPARVTDDRQLLIDLIADAIDAVSDDSGWAQLGSVGSNITKLRPDFDSRLYGHRKFSDLVKSLPEHFEVDEQAASGSGGKSIYVRNVRRAR